uniref:Uncharacterized protein n=1 Tax=Brassica oleracea var. oleracea TaxID=109376 RepID=A0A0D3B674_BRAOL
MHVKKCAKRVIPKYRFHATAVVSLICPDSSNQPISLSCLVCCFNHNCGISKSYAVVKKKVNCLLNITICLVVCVN